MKDALQQAWDMAPALAKRLEEGEQAAKAEMAVLRKDAERYRKLRDKGAVLGLRDIFNLMPSEWDEAVDATAPEDPAVGAA